MLFVLCLKVRCLLGNVLPPYMILIFKLYNLQKYACIEKVHSFPGQGVRSVWTFAENFAYWKAIMATLKIPYIQVGPKMWQRYYSTAIPKDKKDRKNYLKQLAQEKYPATKVTLYNADAILIAEYCKYKYPI